jgi:hypothetical protein
MPEAYKRYAPFLKDHPSGYDGVVIRVGPTGDRGKGSIKVRVKVELPPREKPGTYLRPDMAVSVAFLKM